MVPAPLSKSGAAFFIVWGAATVGVLAVVAAAMLWLCLLAWVGVSLLLAYGIFRRRLA